MAGTTSNRMSLIYPFAILFRILGAAALPLRRDIPNLGVLDAGKDAWAEALSGVSPLILLIGERNTKQLMRDVRGFSHIAGLAFAPLGLISVLTSMIRLCGSRTLRAYLGYEHEARANAAIEMTRANCRGIHAKLIDGFIVRFSEPHPQSKAIATALLQGDNRHIVDESLRQIRSCHRFQESMAKNGTPDGIVHWVFHVLTKVTDRNAAADLSYIICNALGLTMTDDVRDVMVANIGIRGPKTRQAEPVSLPPPSRTSEQQPGINADVSRPAGPAPPIRETANTKGKGNGREPEPKANPAPSSPPSASTDSNGSEPAKTSNEKFDSAFNSLHTSFLCAFDGVSELSASRGTSTILASAIAALSAAAMFAVQMLCLWQENWASMGWIMVIVGYIGMVLGVFAAVWLINSSCESAEMTVQKPTIKAPWTHGVFLAVENTGSLDTTGSRLYKTSDEVDQVFEAVWLKSLGNARFLFAWLTTIFLTASFVCHYLGLRTTKWWLSVGELIICLLAAFARSSNKANQHCYDEVLDIRLDKRCYSTGILDMQKASRLEPDKRTNDTVDLRIYSFERSSCTPLTGELISWQAAKICLDQKALADRLLSITSMSLQLLPGDRDLQRKLVLTYNGGVITEQGLGFPNARICIAFPVLVSELAAPTPLLARTIMRQPQWSLEYTDVNKEALFKAFIGGMYISSWDSLATWWTVAEDQNDMGNQHKNLHGSFMLINLAFFVLLLRGYANDKVLVKAIEEDHRGASTEDRKYAENLVNFLASRLLPSDGSLPKAQGNAAQNVAKN